MIDIFSIQPTVINRSLSGKTLLLAGEPKIGKSEFCASSPRTLIIATEVGYKFIPGVIVQNITKWSEFKMIVTQLEKPEGKEQFDNVAIDTVNFLWDMCTTYICNQNGVKNISDVPWGGGYKLRDEEFTKTLSKIPNLHYGLILTCHTKEQALSTEGEVTLYNIKPDLDKRCLPIINGMVDIIGIITKEWNDKGESERWLLTKATPSVTAGSRVKYLAPKIRFGYKYLEEAIGQAIDRYQNEGAEVVNSQVETTTERTYESLKEEAFELWNKLVVNSPNGEENAIKISKKVEMIFGKPIKISEIPEDQLDLYELLVFEMNNL